MFTYIQACVVLLLIGAACSTQQGFYGNQEGADHGGRQYRGATSQQDRAYGTGRDLQSDFNPETGSRYTARLYTDPEYYGYESEVPGGRAYFKAYRSAPVGGPSDSYGGSRDAQGSVRGSLQGNRGTVSRDPSGARPRAENYPQH